MKLSDKGRALLESFEGFREDAYKDVVGVWTIGYGFTHGVQPGTHMTRAQGEARLSTELMRYEAAVDAACTVEPNQNQFDALVSLAWNIGIDGMKSSSVIRAHNRGDTAAAARSFGLWNKAGGKVWPGLTRRRAAEAALYLKPVPGAIQRIVEGSMTSAHADELPEQDMPQAVDPERPMSSSTINRASVAAGGSAAVAAVATASDAINTVSSLKGGIESLGAWLVPVLLIAVVGLCAYIVYERWQQRTRGNA